MPRPPADPYAVKLDPQKRQDFVRWLCSELSAAESARPIAGADIMHWWRLYEQGKAIGRQKPWADAADLTSYIGTEKVDALSARITKTIFSDPIWTVEGYGDAAKKAPFVEEFHQWKAEEEGVQLYIVDAIKTALIETRGVIEVYEDTATRLTRRTIQAALELTEDGRPILDEDGQWKFQVGPDGKFVEASDQQTPQAETVVDTPERIRTGPAYRLVPYRDFLVLPGHAKDKRDVWGYGKKFTRRLSELLRDAKAGVYDREEVEKLGTDTEIADATTLSGIPIPVSATSESATTTEKELYEVLCLYDFDGKGERWYTVTVSLAKQVAIRIRHDDLGPRYVALIPFRRPARALEGYSAVGHKLITLIEEHTAWRNMNADRAALVVSAPIKRLETALWDPDLQPFGPKQTIDVRDMNEVQPMVIPDLNQASIEREREVLQASERVIGVNDVALGTRPAESRTLGEVQMVTEQSFVRMEEVVRSIQEGLEDLAQIRHRIWQRTLAEQQNGIALPDRVLLGLEARAVPIQEYRDGQKFTADMLQGVFKFKPKGSVETADLSGQRTDFIQFMQVLPQLAAMSPAVQAVITAPRAIKALLAQAIRLFRVPDKQAFIGSEAQAAMERAMMPSPAVPGVAGLLGGGAPPLAAPAGNPAMPQAGGPMA